ncbi:MAG: hypothetical protein QNL57_06050 [Alphaproteobacteria bacterium]
MTLMSFISPAMAQSKGPRDSKVEVETAERAMMASFIGIEAQIVAASSYAVNAPLSAITVLEDLDVGSIVEKGQIIARQDTADLSRKIKRLILSRKSEAIAIAQLTEQAHFEHKLLTNAERQISLQEKVLARVTTLSRQKIIAKEQIDTAEIVLITARQRVIQHQQAIARMSLQIETAKLKQDQYNVDIEEVQADRTAALLRAPEAGQVISVPPSKERYYREGDEVALIRSSGNYEIEADIPVTLLDYLRASDVVNGSDANGQPLRATMRAELAAENQRTATRPVRFDIMSALSNALKAEGARVRLSIPSGPQTQSVTISVDAIIPYLDRAIIFTAEDGKAVRREVRIGASQGNRVAVVSGLEAGQIVITKGNEGLKDGSAITIVSAQ